VLFERESEIGGNVRLGCIPPFKSDLKRLLDYYKSRLDKSNVKYIPGKEVYAREILSQTPNAVVVAAGAEEYIPNIPGIEGKTVVYARDFYTTQKLHKEGEGRIAVIGAGTVGCELAWYLSIMGRKVFLIDILSFEQWLEEEHPTNRFTLLEKLEEYGVNVFDKAIDLSLEKGGKLIRLRRDGIEYALSVDSTILSTGYKPSEKLIKDLREQAEGKYALAIYQVGDCARVRDIHWAIREGYEAGILI
jgi:pyruvate/2-oxoglutarate dehydrogenase complex dihydrolipoamide dehydrogenase (E3) component